MPIPVRICELGPLSLFHLKFTKRWNVRLYLVNKDQNKGKTLFVPNFHLNQRDLRCYLIVTPLYIYYIQILRLVFYQLPHSIYYVQEVDYIIQTQTPS